jgi:hypothetical protein
LQLLPGAGYHLKVNVGIDAEGVHARQIVGHELQDFGGVGVKILGLGGGEGDRSNAHNHAESEASPTDLV